MSVDKIAISPAAQRTVGVIDPGLSRALRMALAKVNSGEVVSVGVTTHVSTGRASHTWQCPGENGHPLVAARRDIEGELILDTSHRERRV